MANIFDYLKKNTLKHPNKVAIILDDTYFTYSQLLNLTENIIQNFKDCKINDKSKILLIEDNSLSHILTLLAASFLNACIVPVNTYYSKKHLKRITKIINIDCVIGGIEYCKFFKKENKIKKIICTDSNKKFHYFFKKNLFKKKLILKRNINKDYIISFTSGSTSNPKAIVFSQKTKIERYKLFKKLYKINKKDRFIISSPLDHSLGMRMFFVPLLEGCTFVLMRKFSPEKYIQTIERHKINFSILVANQIIEIVKNKNFFKKFYLNKGLVSASAALNEKIKRKILMKRINLFEMYGAAEIGTVTSFNINREKQYLKSVGKIYDKRIQIKVLSKNNKLLSPGKIGEIICKTPGKFKYYFSHLKNKKNHKDYFYKDFFKTGDLGYLNKKKYLYYVGRKKNIIRRNGITIYPEDLEKELTKNSRIKEVAVCSNQKNNKTIIYLFVKKEEKLQYNYVRDKCLRNLSTFQLPNKIIFVKEFPKTNLGKIDKIKLMRLYI